MTAAAVPILIVVVTGLAWLAVNYPKTYRLLAAGLVSGIMPAFFLGLTTWDRAVSAARAGLRPLIPDDKLDAADAVINSLRLPVDGVLYTSIAIVAVVGGLAVLTYLLEEERAKKAR